MTIKISQLGTIGAVQGNTLVPIVGNVGGTLTTLQSNVSQLQTYIIGTAFTDIANLYANATATAYSFANVWANLSNVAGSLSALSSTESAANIGMHGYVDYAISSNVFVLNAAIVSANVGMLGYVNQGNVIQANIITQANLGMLGYVNTVVSNVTTITNQIANIATYSNVNVRSYLNSVNIAPYSNVNVASYLTTQNITSYSNIQVAQFLNSVSNVNAVLLANVTSGPVSISPGTSGNVLTSNGTNWYSNALPASYSNVQVAAYLNTQGYNLYSNVNVAAYLAGSISTGNIAVSGNVTATSGNVWTKYIKTTPSTVANLVLANVAGAGARAFVTDANTVIFGSAVTGGFGNSIPVFSNGTNWYVG